MISPLVGVVIINYEGKINHLLLLIVVVIVVVVVVVIRWIW